ncbi:hypothetical protein [Nocardia caishijiensis]|uniref:DUF8020 domain-containing protein n=1 Tax=Nocardia caishijiensis TaxID=184756 RepID=A0ABQ6YUW4_9NOCA|nr:hypothetical protein [Nocardia caishijiensis]KAF0849251.1 hypothetical protein FNL39_101688 [Nocardia caishijiensis]
MNFRKTAAGAALVIGAMTVSLGTAHADPVPAPAQDIKYSVKMVDKTIVATLQNGTFAIVEQEGETPEAPKTKVAEIKDTTGVTVVSLPIDFTINGTDIPAKAEVVKDNTVLELTPERPAGVELGNEPVGVKPVLKADPIASAQENQKAINDFSSKFSIGTAIGTFVGTAIGAVVGCVFGLPLFGVGCLAGLPLGAAVGGIIGMIAIGGPTMLAAGIELLNVMQAPEGTTVWAEKPKN